MKKITLIGFMGSGKTTVSQLVAQTLGWEFIDSDTLIQKQCGCTIPQLFAERGENYFRQLEHHTIREICSKDKEMVISTGGGVVENGYNMLYLRTTSTVIWLYADLNIIQKRLAQVKDRPLLKQSQQDLLNFFNKRQSLYQRYADVWVDANQPLSAVQAEVLRYVSSRN